MSFLANDNDSSDGEENYEKIYWKGVINPSLLLEQVFTEYKDLAKSTCNKLRTISLGNQRTFGDYLSGSSLGWNQEVQLSNKDVEEERGLFDIVKPDTPYTKIIAAIMTLLGEVGNFTAGVEDKIYEPLLVFGEEKEFLPHDVVDENKEYYVTKLVGMLNEIHETIKNLNVLLKNLINQLHYLYSRSLKEYQQVYKKILLKDAFDAIGSILAIFINIDMIVVSNTHLLASWKGFKAILFGVRSDMLKYNINERQLRRIERLVKRFDAGVMGCDLFKKIIEQDMNMESLNQEKSFKIAQNPDFEGAFKSYLMDKIKRLDEVLGGPNESFERKDMIVLMCNYVLYTRLFRKTDPKMFKNIWALQKKAPVIQIVGHITFKSESFLKLNCISESSQKLDPKDMRQHRLDYLKTLNAAYENKMEEYYLKIGEWCSLLNSPTITDLAESRSAAENMNEMAKRIIQGVAWAAQVKLLTDDLLLLHYTEHVDIKPNLLIPLMKAIAIVKGVDFEINTKITQLSLLIPLMKRLVQNQLTVVWNDCLASVEKQAKSDWRDFLRFAFNFAVESSKVSITHIRYKVLHLLQPVLCAKELIKPDFFVRMEKYFNRMTWLQNLQQHLYHATHFVYFYKIRGYSSLFFDILGHHKASIHLLKYLFRAFEDSKRLLSRVAYLEEKDILMTQYKKELMTTFNENIIDPTVKSVENSLRIKIHSYYIEKIRGENPMKEGTLDIKHVLKCEPLFLFGERINIKSVIEEKLTKQFYNFTAFNPKDWQTYEDMKCLAYNLYGLELQDNLLPPQKVEQGLDIIYIVKRLQEFVFNYHFSLHTQVFFERTDDTKKSINVFGVAQAANSFHTHGIGIRNTVLNAVFKIVSKKMNVINQLLYEDCISNLLYGEANFWKEKKEQLGVKYPLERAEEIARRINDFGSLSDGSTLLDKFRKVITQIGNALGFVGVAKCAYKRYCYDIQQFVTERKEEKCEQLARDSQQTAETCAAAVLVDELIGKECGNIGSEDFQVFLKMFDEETLRSEECKHLDLFYMIVPALTTNFVNSFMQAKNTLSTKNMNRVYFCDDGFAVGIAYFLKIFKQTEKFAGLNWFESVIEKYGKEKSTKSQVLSTEQNMMMKKAEAYKKEFEWLFYSFVAAQQFFKEE